MKSFILFYILALLIVFSNEVYNVQIIRILSPTVASDGYLILDSNEIKFPLGYDNLLNFTLSIENIETSETYELKCFFYQFKNNLRFPRIGCRTNGLPEGLYKLEPIDKDISLNFDTYQILIKSFNLLDFFEITSGKEVYFYDKDEINIYFKKKTDIEYVNFKLFEPITDSSITMYLGDGINLITSTCSLDDNKALEIKCKLTASEFPQDTPYQKFNVYIKDSNGNKKYNQFIVPINIDLQYLLN